MQKKKAISLVVLVITIIVMIILASAIIMSLSNTNVLDRAEKAVDVTNEKTLKEVVSLKWMEGYTKGLRGTELREYVVSYAEEMPNAEDYVIVVRDTGAHIIKRGDAWFYAKDSNGRYTMVKRGDEVLEIGDYITYTATGTDYTGNWIVLGAGEDGSLLIISEEVTEALPLKGIEGVVNGITKLDNACSKYAKGYGAQKGRNIRMKDINKITGYNPNNVGTTDNPIYDPDWEGTGTLASEYGIEKELYWIGSATKIQTVDTTTGNISNLTYGSGKGVAKYYDGKTIKTVTMSSDASETNKQFICTLKSGKYGYSVVDCGISQNTKLYNTIVVQKGGTVVQGLYWVAEIRYNAGGYWAMCNVQKSGTVGTGANLLSVWGTETSQNTHNIRPIVELRPDIELTGSSTEGWTIIKN